MADFLSNLPPIGSLRSPRPSPRSNTPSPIPGGFPGGRDSRPSSSRCNSADFCLFRSPIRSARSTPAFRRLPSLPRSSYTRRDIGNRRYSSLSSYHQYQSPSPRSASGELYRSSSEDCLKCMLRMPHTQCESHKYIRVGGGYRHSYWYIKSLLEDFQAKQALEILRKARLEAIEEKSVRAIKTYIRTKSGRLIERVIFLTEEDYQQFKSGGGGKAAEILKKYLTKDEAKNLDSWEKDEVKAIKTFIRTKSGKLVERLVYVTKDDYEKIKQGGGDPREILKKYVKPKAGERIDGWGEAEMKQVKTYVRTKSGRLIEKIIMVSKEDYEKLQEITKKGGDPATILGKYVAVSEGEKIESWSKPEPKPMKVIKTYVRTKSGKLIEKTILMTEEEYKAFQESGGDVKMLKKFMNLTEGEEIENWEKASTVYAASEDDEEIQTAKTGTRIIGKDGEIYEIVEDPITGKKFKKKVTKGGPGESDIDSGIGGSLKNGPSGKNARAQKAFMEVTEEEMYEALNEEEREKLKKYKAMKAGKRNEDSDSEYSYRSVRSAGGTRHVKRRRKRADGTYSAEESYHSDQDIEGQERRRRRRRARKHGSDSEHSYYSVVSAGGTRRVKRRKKLADGTRGDEESYHSSDSEYFAHLEKKGKKKAAKAKLKAEKKKNKVKKRREHGSDSEYSYYSDVSVGGTHHRKRRRRKRDAHGNVVGHSDSEAYTSPSESDSDSDYSSSTNTWETISDGKGGKIRVKKPKLDKHGNPRVSRKDREGGGKDGKGGKGKRGRGRGGHGGDGSEDSSTDFSGSDCTTDEEEVQKKLAKMTKEEREIYLKEREKRKEKREQKRKEKYGERYEEIMEKHERKKKEKKERVEREEREKQEKYKSMVDYGKGKGRGLDGDDRSDGREPGMGHDEWGASGKKGGKGRKGRYKDGNEADSESEEGDEPGGRRRRKGKGKHGEDGSDSEVEVTIIRDEHGNIIKKIIRKKGKDKDGEDADYDVEYEYDAEGNLIGTKKVKKKKKKGADEDEESDGDYFEVGADGQIKLKSGKRKIDISKLTDEDLRKLGIDPTLSKKEITRLLKEKFGDAIKITDHGRTIGIKPLADYGSDVNTDDLADDSDLDTDTLTGMRRVNVLMRKGGQRIIDHMKKIIEQSKITDGDYAKDLDERDSGIDFLHHYRLVDGNKIEGYARAFVVEDQDWDTVVTNNETRRGIDGVPTLQSINKKQLEYVFKVLNIDENTLVTFRMFAVVSALCERVTKMDHISRRLLEICNLTDIERKMDLYKSMFYTNVSSDRDPNFITSESLLIELIAGGLNWKQQNYIMDRLCPNYYGEVSFLDYILYIPLFLSMHDNICDNPLDMSDDKYADMGPKQRKASAAQRDMNPLGYPLKKNTAFINKRKAKDLLDGKQETLDQVKNENLALLAHRDKLPDLIDGVQKKY